MNVAAIVRDYTLHRRKLARRELCYYIKQPSLADAIREATLSRLPGNKQHRHPHQRRIPARVLQEAERRLQGIIRQLRATKSFADLHCVIGRQINPIRGIGDLAVYDIAHRIGAYLRLAPEAVYLHAGTRQGARVLNLRGKRIEVRAFPQALRKLSAAEIEDCLCIYRDVLRGSIPLVHRSACAKTISVVDGCIIPRKAVCSPVQRSYKCH